MAEYQRSRRTTRTHGERKQDREARRQFEYEARQAPAIVDEIVVVTPGGDWLHMTPAEYDRGYTTVGGYWAQEKRREK